MFDLLNMLDLLKISYTYKKVYTDGTSQYCKPGLSPMIC
jgi:hypothetical protein